MRLVQWRTRSPHNHLPGVAENKETKAVWRGGEGRGGEGRGGEGRGGEGRGGGEEGREGEGSVR